MRFYYILASVLFFNAAAPAQKHFTVVNSLPQTRTDELITLQRSDIDKMPGNKTGAFLVLQDQKGKLLTVQQDDLDGDGRWNEAVFLYTFLP